MNRTCRNCKTELPLEQFPLAGVVKGVTYRRHLCSKCYTRSKSGHRRKRNDWLTEYKKTLKCAKCGNNDFRVLDFDHLRDKEFAIGNGRQRGYSKSRLMAEIAKCQVLCANCHRIKTYEERKL